MDQRSIESSLSDLNIPAIRFFDSIDSTNAEAWRWVDACVPHLAIVVAEEQTAGRGRVGRRWITPHAAGLAFSLVLLPPFQLIFLTRLAGLGALSVHNALRRQYGLASQLKWPNDVLVNRRKVAGVLVESRWSGSIVDAVVVGIGINVAPGSVSAENLPPEKLNFPAACLEDVIGHPVERLELLHATLYEFIQVWLPRLSQPDFMREWESSLAFMGEWVEISPGKSETNLPVRSPGRQADHIVGKVLGLSDEGALRLFAEDGTIITVAAGDVHLRPVSADQLSKPQE